MNFWDLHGLWFITFMFLFPRITMLVVGVATGGFWWWMGWLFTPGLLVAIIATNLYWDTNTVLVIFTWLWALGSTRTETKVIRWLSPE